jgi:glycosyltransferase involved in cell wall biosynthesis
MTQTDKPKVLYISHGHPAVRPGGAEGYALDLYEEVRAGGVFEPVFLARIGPPMSPARSRDGALISAVEGDSNQYFFYTDLENWDWFYGRPDDKDGVTWDYRNFLLAQKPDVLHFQHTVWMGYELLRVARNTLPDVPIVYMLHEYLPICHHHGQMVRTMNNELCQEESPRRCHECFPQITQQAFYMRKRFVQSHLALVDTFIAPSEYVRDRYADWGVPAERIQVLPYAKPTVTTPVDAPVERPRNRFGFFGQFTPFKGADVLLEAMEMLGDGFRGHLWVYGANLEMMPPAFQERVRALMAETKATVTFAGSYEPSEVGRLMTGVDWVLVPSIWWETGPLVVLEAFQHGRPVISSDIGGMSEKVTHGVNGLHFRSGDAAALADVMQQAADTPGLWEELCAGIPAVPDMTDHAGTLSGLYKRLLAERSRPAAPASDLFRSRPMGTTDTASPNGGKRPMRKKLLFVSRGHPAVGARRYDDYALDVYEGVRDAGNFEAVFLARSGPPDSVATRYHEGRPITPVNDDPNQYLFYTDPSDYDEFFGRSPNKMTGTRFFRAFLLAQKPDLVHFQHTMYLGYDILRVTRNALPGAPIVYTLHDFHPICHHHGRMVRTGSGELCQTESPRRCHECFSDIAEHDFYMRKRWIQSHMSLVDLFVTPSLSSLEQYVEWGIPRDRIRCETLGSGPASAPEVHRDRRNRFGFFGDFSSFEGVDTLLEAIPRLGHDFDGHVWLHGAGLDSVSGKRKEKLTNLLEEVGHTVTVVGEYAQRDLANLMSRIDWVVVPSRWWETAPLVVLDAFRHGLPVICSDVGGMAETVEHDVSGLHFRRADPSSLADVMRRAATEPGLWDKLRAGIPEQRPIDDYVASLEQVYGELLASGPATASATLAAAEAARHA